jgi:hypothetical protein
LIILYESEVFLYEKVLDAYQPEITKMKCEGDERGGIEGGFRTAQIPFEAFAVLTPVEAVFEFERRKKLEEGKGK